MKSITCIVCPNGCRLNIEKKGCEWAVSGNLCIRGREFAIGEMTSPKRTLCSTVRTVFHSMPRLPVRTRGEIPKEYINDAMKEINKVRIERPVHSGDVIIGSILGTGVDIISTSDMYLYLDKKS